MFKHRQKESSGGRAGRVETREKRMKLGFERLQEMTSKRGRGPQMQLGAWCSDVVECSAQLQRRRF